MNKKGNTEDLMKSYLVYLILLVVFLAGMLLVIYGQRQGADIWSDYYSKEIVKVIDFSNAGDKICLDVHRPSVIAKDNEVRSYSEIFSIDNKNKDICVKLSKGIKRCYNYFNNVEIVNLDFKLAEGRNENDEIVNILCFDIIKSGVENAA